jgi:alpha-mannosidase
VQLISTAPTVLSDEVMDASQVERVLRRIHRRELFGRLIDRYELSPGELVFHVAEVPSTADFDLLVLRRAVAGAAAAHPGEWSVRTLAEARTTVLAPVTVPASGLAAVRVLARPAPGEASVHRDESNPVREKAQPPTAVTERGLSNGLVSVDVGTDGTLEIVGADGSVLRGVGRLVDGGDRGDSYNYGPPAGDLLVDSPTRVLVEPLEDGPLRARLRVTRVYDWPVALAGDRDRRSPQTTPTPVETLVELRVGEPFVRVTTSFLNQSADHRLRLHVPLPSPALTSAGAGQFAVTSRGLVAEGGWGEHPVPTFPAESFVSAGAATVLLDRATEYELVDGGAELAVTLLRAVGSISVNVHPWRDEPAASEIPAPGAQDLGVRVTHRFAIVPSATGWRGAGAGAVALAEEFRNDVLARRGSAAAGGVLPADRVGLRVDGADVLVSSVRRRGTGIDVRMTAMSDDGATARLTGAFTEATTVDLLGRPLSTTSAVGELEVELGPWEIRTVVIR